MLLLLFAWAAAARRPLMLADAVSMESYRALVAGCWPSLYLVAAGATEFAPSLFFGFVKARELGRELNLA